MTATAITSMRTMIVVSSPTTTPLKMQLCRPFLAAMLLVLVAGEEGGSRDISDEPMLMNDCDKGWNVEERWEEIAVILMFTFERGCY